MPTSALTHLLLELVARPSPNPPGDNRAVAAFIADWLAACGATVQVLAPPGQPQAQSVVAVTGHGAPVIMLHAHSDTVPVGEAEAAEWLSDPFVPELRGGHVYGKGSVDDKGPLAAMMVAFRKLAAETLRGTVVLVAAADEEMGGQWGSRWLAEAGHLPDCDLIIVGEQTANRVATAHKGVMRARVTTHGRSVHATTPDRGVNAIVAMARVVLALEAYHRQLAARHHPLVGQPSCNVGVIQGGSTANAVADWCGVQLDRRLIPGETPEQVEQELRAVLSGVDIAPATGSVQDFQYSRWFDSGELTGLGRAFMDCASRHTGQPAEPTGYLPGSDAKHLLGVARGEMLIFGPGSYEVSHSANENVSVAELETCEAILSDFLSHTLTVGAPHG